MQHRSPRRLAAAAAMLMCAAPAGAVTLSESLDLSLARLVAETGTPGASATVTRNGQVVWSGAAGLADPAAGTAFTTGTLSSIASVTKLFVSTIATALAEDGRVNLDGAIAQYLPQSVPGAERVTVRQLVEMTVGYADVEALPKFEEAFKDPNHAWTREELFAEITAPQFEPGTQYDYSNTNYLLLGQVIDSAYPGGTAAAFRDYVAGPAELGDTAYFDRDPAVAGRVAHGFSTRGGVTTDVSEGALDLVNTSVWGTLWTDGGIVATSGGVARFADALYGGQLLNAENTAAAQVCGYILSNRCWDGFIGAFNGYSAFVFHDPERDVTIAAVTNGLNEDSFSQAAFLSGMVGAYEAAVSPVPLPAGLPLLALGLAALFGLRRVRSAATRR